MVTNIASLPQSRLRVMFYLPVVTPWWFASIVVHLIRVMARDHDVHVLIPAIWRNTGLGQDQPGLIDDLDHVQWHFLDGPDHPKLRTDASGEDDLIELVEAIAPNLTLCRSADIVTPSRFPGTVRHIMEGAAPPLVTGPGWVTLSHTLFDYGIVPEFAPDEAARLDRLSETLVSSLAKNVTGAREGWLKHNDLPRDKTIVGLPLEYEHEENFFSQHHRFPDNASLITAVADMLPEGTVLAVTNHPLNDLYGDNSGIEKALAALSAKAILLPSSSNPGAATLALSQHCDGMIIGNSKSWSVCAAFGTPWLRLSDFKTGGWTQAYTDFVRFMADIREHRAQIASSALARRWFTYHLLDQAFDPSDPALTASEIIARVDRQVDQARWVPALARYHAQSFGIAA